MTAYNKNNIAMTLSVVSVQSEMIYTAKLVVDHGGGCAGPTESM